MPLLPLFPLGALAVPGQPLALQVFEPRYLQLLCDLADLPPEERVFGVVAIRRGHEVGPGRSGELYAVGTGVLIEHLGLAGQLVRLRARGTRRFHLDAELSGGRPYLQGGVTWLAEPEGDAGRIRELVAELRAAYTAYGRAGGATQPLPDEPAPQALAYAVLARLALPLPQRQELLELATTADRLEGLTRLLQREERLIRRLGALPGGLDLGGSSLN